MFYRVVRFLVTVYLKIFNRWEIEGHDNIPVEGPVVIVANHVSQWDPLFMGCSMKRTIHYMAKEELFRIPIFKQIIVGMGAFPIKRGKVDRNALRTAAKYLEEGEILGLFPEGTRSKTKEMLPFQQGAALFALRSGSPIVPVGLNGTKKAFPKSLRGKIKVKIGKPMLYPDIYGKKIKEEDLNRVTQDMVVKVTELLEHK